MTRILAFTWVLLSSSSVHAQTLPAETKIVPQGPICGLTGANAADMAAKVRSARGFARQAIRSDRFDVYVDSKFTRQWLITKKADPAHPAVSCREFVNEGGGTAMVRTTRCDADGARCAALITELQQLDEQLRAYVRSRAGD